MKNLINIILLLTTISISAQLSFDLEKSNIKWTGKEITTKSHFGSLKLLKASIEESKPIQSQKNLYLCLYTHR